VVNNDGYNIYTDDNGFVFQNILVFTHIVWNKNRVNEKGLNFHKFFYWYRNFPFNFFTYNITIVNIFLTFHKNIAPHYEKNHDYKISIIIYFYLPYNFNILLLNILKLVNSEQTLKWTEKTIVYTESESMNILLVYPQYPETFWSFHHALRFIGKKAPFPPLGLMTVAAMLPKEWTLKLVDLNVSSLKDEDIVWADYVFISAMLVQKESVSKLIKRCIQLNRKIVAGGPLFTSEYEFYPEVHHLVLNEAEITLPRFLSDVKQGCPQSLYNSSQWADLSATPVPVLDIIKLKHYASMCIQYSRGCPYDCDFCDVTVLFGHNPRTKSVDQILLEMNTLYDYGWRGNVFFVDDNLIGNKKHLKYELLPAVIEWMKKRKYPFSFNTQVSINLAQDDTLINLLVQAGFDMIFVGIETPNEESLIECGKLHNTKINLLNNVKKLQAAGLQVQGGFIIGFDSDKTDIFSRMSQFIEKSGIVTSMVGLLNALPGTKLYNRLKKENRIIDKATGNNTDYSTNFLTKMDYATLIEGYKKLVKDIYHPEEYYKRIKTFLRNYKLPPALRTRFSFYHIRAVWMSFFKIGLKKGVRKHFWKLMLWTAVRKPRSIPLALTLAIYGQHFNRYFNSVV